jgi:hypothetical protein
MAMPGKKAAQPNDCGSNSDKADAGFSPQKSDDSEQLRPSQQKNSTLRERLPVTSAFRGGPEHPVS